MHIVFSSDNNYAQHLGVTLASLLKNLAPDCIAQIYVIDGGISTENKQKLAMLQSIRPFALHYISVSISDFDRFPLLGDHLTIATYFRLKIPELLPHLDKVLYLDIDMIVESDLSPLWSIDLPHDVWVGAVIELGMKKPFLQSIGLNEDDFYFNAGVLLMNLTALRKIDFNARCIEFVTHYKQAIRFVDQDVLNHICANKVLWIDPRYNVTFGLVDKAHKLDRYPSPYDVAAMENAISNPAIIHYTGGSKPWHYACRHPMAGRYMAYIKDTSWQDYQYPDKNFKAFKSKYLFFFRQWLKRHFLDK